MHNHTPFGCTGEQDRGIGAGWKPALPGAVNGIASDIPPASCDTAGDSVRRSGRHRATTARNSVQRSRRHRATSSGDDDGNVLDRECLACDGEAVTEEAGAID